MPTPKKPTKLKVLQGTNQKCRRNENEPNPENKIPSPPGHLNQTASVEWGRISTELYRLGLLSEIDRAALAGYCDAYALWAEACEIRNDLATKDPKTRGMIETTTNGNIIQSPIIGIINQSRKAMKEFLVEFGMSPSSRTNVSANKAKKNNEDGGFTTYKKRG